MNSQRTPIRGQEWRHKNGNLYTVLLVTNLAASEDRQDEYPITVCYQRRTDGTIWSRPLSKWHDSFTRVTEGI